MPDPIKRYFHVDFGITYKIVARDESHVLEILREADADFDDTLASEGAPDVREIAADQAAILMIHDEDEGPVALSTFALGCYASSEF